jgi:dihydroneopterin aldolase
MDRVFIHELQIDTIIGILPWERRVRQTLSLDLEMAWDNRPAAQSGAIGDALDYAAVAQRLLEFVGASEFELIESLAEAVVDLVQAEFAVPWLRLRLSKPGAVAEAAAVGVIIERGDRHR